MSYATAEASQKGSLPIELYEFSYQNLRLYYTSTEIDIVVAGITYTSTQIDRSKLLDSGEIGKNNQMLTVPQTFPVSELFGAGPPDDIVILKIRRYQASAPTDIRLIWISRVTSVNWPLLRAELNCESVFTALRQTGLHRVYTLNCPFVLYGGECKAASLPFTETHVVDNQVGNVLTGSTLGSHGDGWWAGGKVIWEYLPGFLAKRGIKNHGSTTLEITFAFNAIPNGTVVTFMAGCDHSYSTCGTKFANQLNYGGFNNMVQKNP